MLLAIEFFQVQQHTFLDIQGDACNCSNPPCTCGTSNSINITDITNGDFEGKVDYPVQISGYFEDEWVRISDTNFYKKNHKFQI